MMTIIATTNKHCETLSLLAWYAFMHIWID